MYHAIVFLPLVGALLAGLFGRQLGPKLSEGITTGLLAFSALLSWGAFLEVPGTEHATRVQVATWFTAGDLVVDWAFRIDTLTVIMLVVVTSVSTLVHLYSIGYMEEDPHRPRFFAYLSLFTFAMLMLVTSDNLVQMFFGWEGVGLASYLLIGFWYEKPSANAAAMKAFIVNRVGDFGFSLGIFLVFVLTGSIAFDGIFARAPEIKDATRVAVDVGPNPVIALAPSPDGRRIAAATAGGAVTIIERGSGTILHRLVGPGLPVWSIAWRQNGRELLTGGSDRLIRRWDAETGEPIGPLAMPRPADALAAYHGDRGAEVFRACVACHALGPEEAPRAGPTLAGIMGRRIATAPGYRYSEALKGMDIVWDARTIAQLFEVGPARYTPGTRMPEQTINRAEDREALVRFLERATAMR